MHSTALIGLIVGALLALASLVLQQSFWAWLAIPVVVCGIAVNKIADGPGWLSWSVAVPCFYMVFFVGIPVVLEVTGAEGFSGRTDVVYALLAAALGIGTFGFGSALVRTRTGGRRSTVALFGGGRFQALSSPGAALALTVAGAVAVVYSFFFGYFGLTSTLSETGSLAGIMSVLSTLAEAGLVLAWIGYFRDGRRAWLLVGIVGLVLALAAGLFSKSKGAAIFPAVNVGVAYFLVRGRIPGVALVSVVLAFFFVIQPFVTIWRALSGVEYSDRIEMISQGVAVLSKMEIGLPDFSDVEVKGGFSRGVLDVAARITDEAGKIVPYKAGETFVAAADTVVPRFLWPGKPDNSLGNEIGHTYGAIENVADEVTNVAPTLVGEFFANFGWIGVAIGMFLLGLVAGWVDWRVTTNWGSWFWAWTFLKVFGGQEATLAQAYIPLAKAILSFMVLFAIGDRMLKAKATTHDSGRSVPKLTSTVP